MRYTKIAKANPFEGAPKINLASIFGASPNKPIILRIPVSGQRPITYGAEKLPNGLVLKDNILSGLIPTEGNYEIILTAENTLGKTEKKVTLEIKEGNILVTPLMGFSTWNAFGNAVTQKNVTDVADRFVELGLSEYGYSYINTDSG